MIKTNKIGTGDQAKEFLFSIYKNYIYIIYLDTIRNYSFIVCLGVHTLSAGRYAGRLVFTITGLLNKKNLNVLYIDSKLLLLSY